MRAMVLFFVSVGACGQPGALQRTDVDVPHNAFAVGSAAELPECNDQRREHLYFVESDKMFRVCREGGWLVIDLRGPAGATGASGPSGKDAMGTQVAGSMYCGGQLASQPVWFAYSAALMKSGDVFATGSIREGSAEVSGTQFYSSQQVGAQTAAVIFSYDLLGAANGGWWKIEVNRTTLITTITSFDSDAAGGSNSWVMTPDKCVLNVY